MEWDGQGSRGVLHMKGGAAPHVELQFAMLLNGRCS